VETVVQRKDRRQNRDAVLPLRRSCRGERRANKAYTRETVSTASVQACDVLLGTEKANDNTSGSGYLVQGRQQSCVTTRAQPVAFERFGNIGSF
jgi:hypothetical protein